MDSSFLVSFFIIIFLNSTLLYSEYYYTLNWMIYFVNTNVSLKNVVIVLLILN